MERRGPDGQVVKSTDQLEVKTLEDLGHGGVSVSAFLWALTCFLDLPEDVSRFNTRCIKELC